MQKQPLVSIIVPYFNRDEMLNQLLSTIPDRDDLEVLLVDDHSDQKFTPQRIFYHTKIRRFKNDPDQKYAGTARNVGLQNATGIYAYFADSDDLLNTGNFEFCMSKISGAEYDVIYTLCGSFLEDGKIGSRHIAGNWIIEEYARTSDPGRLIRHHQPVAKFIKMRFLRWHNLQFQDTRVSNDVMFNARMVLGEPRSGVLLRETYKIRQGNPSLTTEISVSSITQRVDVMKQYNTLLRRNHLAHMQVAAASQLRSIIKQHPQEALKLAWDCYMDGTPLLPRVSDIYQVIRRRYHAKRSRNLL